MKSNIDYALKTSKSINGAVSLKVWMSSRISRDCQELLLDLVRIKNLYSQLINKYYIVPSLLLKLKNNSFIVPAKENINQQDMFIRKIKKSKFKKSKSLYINNTSYKSSPTSSPTNTPNFYSSKLGLFPFSLFDSNILNFFSSNKIPLLGFIFSLFLIFRIISIWMRREVIIEKLAGIYENVNKNKTIWILNSLHVFSIFYLMILVLFILKIKNIAINNNNLINLNYYSADNFISKNLDINSFHLFDINVEHSLYITLLMIVLIGQLFLEILTIFLRYKEKRLFSWQVLFSLFYFFSLSLVFLSLFGYNIFSLFNIIEWISYISVLGCDIFAIFNHNLLFYDLPLNEKNTFSGSGSSYFRYNNKEIEKQWIFAMDKGKDIDKGKSLEDSPFDITKRDKSVYSKSEMDVITGKTKEMSLVDSIWDRFSRDVGESIRNTRTARHSYFVIIQEELDGMSRLYLASFYEQRQTLIKKSRTYGWEDDLAFRLHPATIYYHNRSGLLNLEEIIQDKRPLTLKDCNLAQESIRTAIQIREDFLESDDFKPKIQGMRRTVLIQDLRHRLFNESYERCKNAFNTLKELDEQQIKLIESWKYKIKKET
jgi:hypothetical protein